jgi:glycosyltransferase involved in cell wall biosynthesis
VPRKASQKCRYKCRHRLTKLFLLRTLRSTSPVGWACHIISKMGSLIMKIAYANTTYRSHSPTGSNAHVRQFVENAVELGHEIWTWADNQHPQALQLPTTQLGRWKTLSHMDAICTRINDRIPIPSYIRWSIQPYKKFLGSPVTVWEFNTVPEFGSITRNCSGAQIKKEVERFTQHGQDCDIAVCVSNALAGYVREHLNIQNVLTIPNGSDPELFHPGVAPVQRVTKQADRLNVVWIGSAHLSWHNFDLLRDTAQFLQNSSVASAQKITFHIIGRAHALMREMPANVVYHGSENYEALPHWLSAMDVGLCLYHPGPADYSSPLKVFDYMASGLTVVGTVQPQLREIFRQLDQPDLLVPLSEPKLLAEALIGLVENPHRVKLQGQKGRQLVIDFYNWSRAVKDTIRAIEEVRQARR